MGARCIRVGFGRERTYHRIAGEVTGQNCAALLQISVRRAMNDCGHYFKRSLKILLESPTPARLSAHSRCAANSTLKASSYVHSHFHSFNPTSVKATNPAIRQRWRVFAHDRVPALSLTSNRFPQQHSEFMNATSRFSCDIQHVELHTHRVRRCLGQDQDE
ncbi:hypothetical protein BD779DRAFT_1123576 [Infundibulicybe gibba]|nr:hypothetical protein BD779DRAFT_1123576 [Infundibulicybe gibba]